MENKLKGFAKAIADEAALRFDFLKRAEQAVPISSVHETRQVVEGERLLIRTRTIATGNEPKSALLTIRFTDAKGEHVKPKGISYSEKHGDFVYLKPSNESQAVLTEIYLDVPLGAVKVEVRGVNFNRYVRTLVTDKVDIINLSNFYETVKGDSKPCVLDASKFEVSVAIPKDAQTVTLNFEYSSGPDGSSGPISVHLLTEHEEILQPSGLPQHAALGAYFLLEGQPGTKNSKVQLVNLPKSATGLRLKGESWGKKTARLERAPLIQFGSEERSGLEPFLRELGDEQLLFIVDTTAPPLGHASLALRPNNLSLEYAKRGIKVIFLPFGTLQEFPPDPGENLFQIPRDRFDELIHNLLKVSEPSRCFYISSSFPNFESLAAVNRLKAHGWHVIYECRDDMEEFNRVGYSKWYTPQLERQMIRVADKTTAVSPSLLQKLRDLSPEQFEGTVIPNGVSVETLRKSSNLRTIEAMERRKNLNTVGYVGHLTDSWFDWNLLRLAASELPGHTFEIVGHGAPEDISLPGNIRLLGPKNHEELADIVNKWNVGIIPFIDSPLTRSVDPNKIYEYFAWGLTCVTTAMGSVDDYPFTYVYKNADQFVEFIKEASSYDWTSEDIDELEQFLQSCSWANRAEENLNYFLDKGADNEPN